MQIFLVNLGFFLDISKYFLYTRVFYAFTREKYTISQITKSYTSDSIALTKETASLLPRLSRSVEDPGPVQADS